MYLCQPPPAGWGPWEPLIAHNKVRNKTLSSIAQMHPVSPDRPGSGIAMSASVLTGCTAWATHNSELTMD